MGILRGSEKRNTEPIACWASGAKRGVLCLWMKGLKLGQPEFHWVCVMGVGPGVIWAVAGLHATSKPVQGVSLFLYHFSGHVHSSQRLALTTYCIFPTFQTTRQLEEDDAPASLDVSSS